MTWLPGKPVDRSKHKPIYIVIAKDQTVSKTKLAYYKAADINTTSFFVEIRGQRLTPAEANQLTENPRETVEGKDAHVIIAATEIVRIENITYKQPIGEEDE